MRKYLISLIIIASLFVGLPLYAQDIRNQPLHMRGNNPSMLTVEKSDGTDVLIVDSSANKVTVSSFRQTSGASDGYIPVMDGSGNYTPTIPTGTGAPVKQQSPSIVDASMNTATMNALVASNPVETTAGKVLTTGTKTGTGSEYVMSAGPTLTGTTNVIDISGSTIRTTVATGFIVTQTGHALSVGNVLRHNGTIYVTAQADSASNAEVVGILSSVLDANNFVLTTNGKVTGLSGLTAGTTYFLSTLTAGALTADDASVSTQVSKPLLNADSTTSGFFANMRGITILAGTNVIQGTTGGMVDMVAEATATLSGSSTNISVAIPGTATTPVNIIGVQLRVDTLITSGDGAGGWGAAFIGGSTSAICSSQNFAKQTKVNSMSGGDGIVASTNVNIIAQISGVAGGTFNAGVVRAIVYYKKLIAMANAP